MKISKFKLFNIYMPTIVIVSVSIILTIIKVRSGSYFQGDTGNYYILLENIHRGLGPYNQFMATLVQYSYIDQLHSINVIEFCKKSFDAVAHGAEDFNHFRFHYYPILYPLSILLYAFSAPYVTHFIDIFSFISFLYLAYYILVKNNCGSIASLLIIIVISFHPAWSWSIQGAPFPDRIYLPFGLLAFYLIDFKNSTKYGILALTICGMIVEKVILYSGIFLILHTILFYRKNKNIAARLAFGLFMILVFELLKRYQLTANPYYESFINLSPSALINLFKQSYFFNGTLSFLLVNLPFLLVILIKSPRLFIITFAMMIPNIIGNIGGAEKTGYFTHYHTLYFPFLIYSFCISMSEIQKDLLKKNPALKYLQYLLLLLVLAYFYGISFSQSQKIVLNYKNDVSYLSYFSRIYKDKNNYEFITQQVDKYIPRDSKISSVEAGWPYLYQHLNSSFFPYNINNADFLIVNYSIAGNKYLYGGVTSFKGVEVTNAMNSCLNDKIEQAKFNIRDPIKLSGSLAILKKE
jgi:hypothetical protein